MEKTKIQKIYEDSKARGFVNHLIKAYMPTSNITKVWDFEKNQSNKCNVCSQALMSVEDSLKEFHTNKEVIMTGMLDHMKADAQAYLDKTTAPKTENPIIKHVAKGRVLAFTGQKTDTCLCLQCSKDLLEMVQSGLLMGDSNIVYQINQLQRNQVFNRFNDSSKLDKDQKTTVTKIKKRADKRKATLGDLDVLQKLKEQMEKDEN